MSIDKIRSSKGSAFGRLDMKTITDSDLSNAELGLLLRLMSLPETWQFTEAGLCSVYPSDGTTALRSAMKSLSEKGYLSLVRTRNEKGQYGNTHIILREVVEKP